MGLVWGDERNSPKANGIERPITVVLSLRLWEPHHDNAVQCEKTVSKHRCTKLQSRLPSLYSKLSSVLCHPPQNRMSDVDGRRRLGNYFDL